MNERPDESSREPLALLDFEALYQSDPEAAIRRLVRLLLDGRACPARVAFLRELEARSEAGLTRGGETSFQEEIRLICGAGLYAAQEEGLLKPALVHRLGRLACDPEALLAAHRGLTEPEEADADGAAGHVEAEASR